MVICRNFTNLVGLPGHWLIAFFALLSLSACATREVTFQARGEGLPVKVSLLDFGNPDSAGEDLGGLPVTVETAKLVGKMVRFSVDGGEVQYWFFPELAGEKNTVLVKLEGSKATNTQIAGGDGKTGLKDRNRIVRILLKAYQALSGKRFDAAIDLANQALALDPEIAGPYLIRALAQIQLGRREDARTSLDQARAIDPEDQDLIRLQNAVR